MTVLAAFQRLILALWVGGAGLFTFLLTPAIFAHYPRDQAGQVVGVLFPVYFPFLTALAAAALAGFLALRRGRWRRAHRVALLLLTAALAANAANQWVVHPAARAVKAELHAAPERGGESGLRREFGRLHGVSMALNLASLGCGAALLLGGSLWWRREDRP